MDIYERLKVKTYINAWDAVSDYGCSRMEQETLDAMRDAATQYVHIEDLQEAVGREIARMTGNEAAFVIAGTAAGMLMASAVCMVRHPESELFDMLPDTRELRNEFILLRERRTSVGYAIKAAGGKVIDVGFLNHVTVEDIEKVITPKTCAIVYCDTQVLSMKCPPLRKLTLLAHKHDLFMVVQASGQLPPVENLWHYTVDNGADLAVFAGGKAIRGAQQSGILVGRRALIDLMKMVAPPKTGIARTTKEGREEIISVYTALKKFMQPGQMAGRLGRMRRMREEIARALEESGNFKTATLYPGPSGQTYRYLGVEVLGGIAARDLTEALLGLDPGIVVGPWEWHNGFTINTLNLEPGEVPKVVEGILTCYQKLKEGGAQA
jgi:D-glucosaminate-6-phosphate ammonia-lyase